jgi:Zn-dependent alcohol dehydrogenase
MVEDGDITLDAMVSRRYKLDEVNDAFAATAAGEVLRAVLV